MCRARTSARTSSPPSRSSVRASARNGISHTVMLSWSSPGPGRTAMRTASEGGGGGRRPRMTCPSGSGARRDGSSWRTRPACCSAMSSYVRLTRDRMSPIEPVRAPVHALAVGGDDADLLSPARVVPLIGGLAGVLDDDDDLDPLVVVPGVGPVLQAVALLLVDLTVQGGVDDLALLDVVRGGEVPPAKLVVSGAGGDDPVAPVLLLTLDGLLPGPSPTDQDRSPFGSLGSDP